MALYMLSTDVAVCLIRGTSAVLDGRIESASSEDLCISAVTRGELLCGLSLPTKADKALVGMDMESLRRTTHAVLAKLTPSDAKALRKRFRIDSEQVDVTHGRLHPEQTQPLSRVVDQFLARVSCLPWDAAAATHFATVAVELHRVGTPVGTTDAMIAGHAIAVGAVLVTANEDRFSSVRGLKAENWTR